MDQVLDIKFITGELEFCRVHYSGRYGTVLRFLDKIETDECIRQTEGNIKGNKYLHVYIIAPTYYLNNVIES
jgi:hypothetical protein